ncbi:MAG: molybdate ABC transporter permease subunit [Pseudomonadota bacterium]
MSDLLSPLEAEALILSLRVALWCVVISLPIGIGTAWLLARKRFPGHLLLSAVVYAPLVVPPVVVGYLLLVLLGRRGVVGAWLYEAFGITVVFTWQGAAIASAIMGFPLMVRAIRLSLDAVDRRLEDAARTLGAGRWRVWLSITLPLTAPGILAGAVLAFARSLGEFGATITFVSNIPGETRTLPLALYSVLQQPGGDAPAMRLAILSLLLAIVAIAASELLARRMRKQLGV